MVKSNWRLMRVNHNRRIKALEAHVTDLEERYAALENRMNVALEEMNKSDESEPPLM